ncbi:hypothetical protein Cgig2_030147 [Carnegiea gigantea]|uniref:Uncharacterized protein n=1 Tax=Carnegiea gigantea TaxID=171969 RepID=A0A9Q1K0I8_9CARY|nr:hypothetical protein Cgig2_030147 [Carnegiea gigantea]
MSTSDSRTEVMKPLVIKVAFQLFFLLDLISSFHNGHNSTSTECPESEDQGGISLQDGQKSNLQNKSKLEILVYNLENREWNSEARCHRNQSLKDKEFMLTEMRNMMIEKTQAEFFLKEISLMERKTRGWGNWKQKLDIEARNAELLNKLDLVEKLSKSSNPEIELGLPKKDYEKVLKELEQLQKD